MTVGDTQSEESFGEKPWMGPVINETQYLKIWKYIDEAKANGYNIACGGDRDLVAHLGKGYYIPGTVIVDLNRLEGMAGRNIWPCAVHSLLFH